MKLLTVSLLIAQGLLAADKVYEDFRLVECAKRFPQADLQKLVPEPERFVLPPFKRIKDVAKNLRAMNQDELEILYSCLTPGEALPHGKHQGAVIYPKGGGQEHFVGLMRKLGFPIDTEMLEHLAQTLWKGKVFYTKAFPAEEMAEGGNPVPMLRNSILGLVELFPARVYVGMGIMDAGDSVIIDYAFSEDFASYHPKIDFLASRKGLLVRDEIRQIVPGFYLGRAYLDGVFALNFVLLNQVPGGPAVGADAQEAGERK